MNQDDYITERLDAQIEWYDKKSQKNQFWFKSLNFIEVFCAAVIPFVAGFAGTDQVGQIVVGVLGVIIAVCAGVSSLNKYQENWLTYRTTCETLRHEKYLFMTACHPYNCDDAFTQFVERIESVISKENSQWSRYSKEKSPNSHVE